MKNLMEKTMIQKTLTALLLVCSVFTFTANAGLQGNADVAKAEIAAEASNAFGFKVMKELIKDSKGENVFYSPVSAHLAFGMLIGGAAKPTYGIMADALEVDPDDDAINQLRNKLLMEELTGSDEGLKLHIANSLWLENSYVVNQEYVDFARKTYGAKVAVRDFRNKSQSVASEMNKWARDNTNKKIDNIMTKDVVKDLDVVLANATYLKGTWKTEFDPKKTDKKDKPSAFMKEDGGKTTARLMHSSGRNLYGEVNGAQVVELPFKGEKASVTVVLPPAGIDATAYEWIAENTQDENFWNKVDKSLYNQKVHLSVPRFKFKYSKKLNKTLKRPQIGLAHIFRRNTNFDPLSPMGLQVTLVKQDSFVQFDEEGAEAAAVTIIGGVRTTSVRPRRTPVMRVDRPFLVAFRHKSTGAILFAGVIGNPVWK